MKPEVNISHTNEGNICFFEIEGVAQASDVTTINQKLSQLLKENTAEIMVVTVDSPQVESSLIGCLVRLVNECQKHQIQLAICGLNPKRKQFFASMDTQYFFGAFDSKEDFLSHINQPLSGPAQDKLPNLDKTGLNGDRYYLIGLSINWNFSKPQLILGGVGVSVIILGIWGYLLFQYYASIQKTDFFRNQSTYHAQILASLETTLVDFDLKILDLKKSIETKEFNIEVVKKLEIDDTNIEPVSLASDAPLPPVDQLKTNFKAALADEKTLNNKIYQLQQRLIKLTKAKNTLSAQLLQKNQSTEILGKIPSKRHSEILIENFVAKPSKDFIDVSFNLKNIGNQTWSGFFIFKPITKEATQMPLAFVKSEVETFSIKSFRPLKQKFAKDAGSDFVAVKVVLWDRQQNKLVEQTFPIP